MLPTFGESHLVFEILMGLPVNNLYHQKWHVAFPRREDFCGVIEAVFDFP